MSRNMEEIQEYEHQKLIDAFNDMMIGVKVNLFMRNNVELLNNHPLPTPENIDMLTGEIIRILKQSKKPMRKY